MSDDIEGLSEFARDMDNAASELDSAIMAELIRAANDMVSIAKGMTPVRSGELAGSYRIEADPAALSVRVFAGGGEQFYARFIEFGTVKMKAEPFFWPAYRAIAKGLEERLTALMPS